MMHWVSLPLVSTHSLFKFCQDEADRLINQIVMNINFTYNIAALHLTVSCDHLKSQGPDLHFLHFASCAHCWFGVFRNVKARWSPAATAPQSPIPRVSTNRPIYHQNKLTVHKQHNHNATYNNGLWLVETVKMTTILTSDWPRLVWGLNTGLRR